MNRENLDQDLGWAPVQYPSYNTFESGEWRVVTDDDVPVGIVYTNRDRSAGVIWITQTDTVMSIRKMFAVAAQSGMSASDAYSAVESRYAANLLDPSSGTMDGVNAAFNELMQRS